MMKLQILGDRVLVKRSAAETKSPGGIIIPENAQVKSARGQVLAVGAPPKDAVGYDDVQPGVIVLFGKYSGSPLPDDDSLVILRYEELLALEG